MEEKLFTFMVSFALSHPVREVVVEESNSPYTWRKERKGMQAKFGKVECPRNSFPKKPTFNIEGT